MAPTHLPLAQLFMLLFTLCGPIKMIPTFYGVSARMEPPAARSLAFKAIAFATLGIVLAALMGTAQMDKVGISKAALGASAGLLMALVGLQAVLGTQRKAAGDGGPPDALALAFPVVMPPHAFGLIILFSLYASSMADRLGIIAAGAALMVLNLVAMFFAGPIMRKIGMTPLKIFGAVFGIVQLALGVQMIFWGVSVGILGRA